MRRSPLLLPAGLKGALRADIGSKIPKPGSTSVVELPHKFEAKVEISFCEFLGLRIRWWAPRRVHPLGNLPDPRFKHLDAVPSRTQWSLRPITFLQPAEASGQGFHCRSILFVSQCSAL